MTFSAPRKLTKKMENLDSLTNQFFDRREAMRPTARVWLKHAALLISVFFTASIAGVLPPFGFVEIFKDVPDPQTSTEVFNFILSLPLLYFDAIFETVRKFFTEFETFSYGAKFAASLLTILTAHEAGHYVACRLYRIDATLPYFIPMPPLLSPAGTLGAFIKILSPLPSRRATFDVGVAGPIAGFVALLPVLIVGLLTLRQAAPQEIADAQGLYFPNSLLTHLLAQILHVDLTNTVFNPFMAAAWVGMLVTSLNLMPSGQLDGGHAVYAIFGETVHRWTGRITFVVMATISILGGILYSSPSGLLFAVLLAVMMQIKHPEPLDCAPLNLPRKIVAVLTLLIFILCFVPFPVQVR